jgi:hypothetical protein
LSFFHVLWCCAAVEDVIELLPVAGKLNTVAFFMCVSVSPTSLYSALNLPSTPKHRRDESERLKSVSFRPLRIN